jgi:hypothetical protein
MSTFRGMYCATHEVSVIFDADVRSEESIEAMWVSRRLVLAWAQRRRSPLSTPTGSMTLLPNIRRNTNP